MHLAPPTRNPSVTLRQAGEVDREFLFQVYSSTRAEELAQVGWDEEQKQSFLEMQFRAQARYYESEYPGAQFRIILAGGQPAGRLYVHRRENEIRIMDIALLPPYRRQGIGTGLLKEILAEGGQTGRRVTIHVEIFNPAQRLYERLGFREVANNGVYLLLEWTPSGSQSPAQLTASPKP